MADGLSIADSVAITALVISLFALVVGFSQFTQAILGTAEGYRRCASSVIGPWSQFRRRVFRWSEFRFETRYIVPLITLVSAYEATWSGGCFDLDDFCAAWPDKRSALGRLFIRANVAQVLQQSLHLNNLEWHDTTVGKSDSQRTKLREDASNDRKPVRGSSGLEGGLALAPSQNSPQPQQRRYGPRNALPVTWIPLLRNLHVLYLSYHSRFCGDGTDTPAPTMFTPQALQSAGVWWSRRDASELRTCVAIIPVQETWDFMPPDVARPLATSTISTVIVLGLRLGMQWRTLDRARSQMNADGNGYSISSTDAKGLGMILKFSSFAQTSGHTKIVPSRAADKLMCGIVPGDPDLVKQDFNLIDRERKQVMLWHAGSIYSKLGLDDATIETLREQDRWTTPNEVVTLLSCFVPLCNPSGTKFYFPGWRSRQYSVFHFFESRLALLQGIMATEHNTATIKIMQEHFRHLSSKYSHDFYDTFSVEDESKRNEQRLVNVVTTCLSVFQATTRHFVAKGFASANGTDKTWYMQLVAAHARLSAWVTGTPDPEAKTSQELLMKKRQPMLDEYGIKTTYFAEHLYKQVERYVQGIDHPEFGIVQYMQARAFPGSRIDIIQAWWALMLRGVAWDMACECLPYPGEPVPSSYYHDETSVWFT